MIGHAGLVASTRALLEFLDVYEVWGDDMGRRRAGGRSSDRWAYHTGTLRGTNALVCQHGNGINYAVLFNRRAPVSDRSYYVKQFTEILNEHLVN